ncbi:hypothetical protein K6025_00865 [Ehrlichia sp. JZT12]
MSLLDILSDNEDSIEAINKEYSTNALYNNCNLTKNCTADNCSSTKNCIAEFLITLSSTPIENQYLLNFTFKEHQKSLEQITSKSLKGQFEVTLDKENHILTLTEDNTSISLDSDMLFSCLSAIKVNKKDPSEL